MGSGRLSDQKALTLCALILVACLAMVIVGCPFGGDDDPLQAAPEVTSTATAVPSTPTLSPTPDPFAQMPTDQVEARGWLQNILGPSSFSPPCPEKLKAAGVGCAQGDATGDGQPELAYLVPVKRPGATSPHPATLFIRGGSSQKLEEFDFNMTADASILGLAFFQFADRTGDGRPDLSYLRTVCGASGCPSRAVILSWDGTAWRDVGPADAINNVDSIKWDGTGAASKLVIHGGKLPAEAPTEAGPTRAATTGYTLVLGIYTVHDIAKDPPAYLYHAIEDAETAFEKDVASSEPLYRKAITDAQLKDWKVRPNDPDRRPGLVGYALFRLVLIDAVLGKDPTAALDTVIRESKEPLFVYLAEEFRKGFQERGGLVAGCAAVNQYLKAPAGASADAAAYVQALFNYGYLNPPGAAWLPKICPF